MTRKNTRLVEIGNTAIGAGSPVLIQSMTNTPTWDAEKTVAQIHALEEAGCELVRVAVPDEKSARALGRIKKEIRIPLAADVHFDYRLALLALEEGVDKLRLNPGNIGGFDIVAKVAEEAGKRRVPIRIGVNAGSLEKPLIEKYGGVTADALAESVMRHVTLLVRNGFNNTVISVKASSVPLSIAAYEKISALTDYPLHVGITEAGTPYAGAIKSAAGIGAILSRGIGDTIRVSLTGDPVEEITCAKAILKAMGLRKFGVEFISCPTCGRTEIDLAAIAAEVEAKTARLDKNITVAVMGCVVNGPGEAKEADIGIAGGKGCGLLFKKGEIIAKVSESELVGRLLEEIETL